MTYPTDYADPYEAYPIDLDPSDLMRTGEYSRADEAAEVLNRRAKDD